MHTSKEELGLIRQSLASELITKTRPIVDLIPREHDTELDEDPILKAVGKVSISIKYCGTLNVPKTSS